jgi:hypothetical protein
VSEFLQHYLDWGLTDIILVSHDEKEVESGYNLEITTETVVARKGQGFVEVVAQKRVSFAPHAGGSSSGKDSERPITAGEYRRAAKGKHVLDTPAARAGLKKAKAAIDAGYARQAELRNKRAPLYEKLDKLTPKCPNCDRKMSLKEKGGRRFWACNFYPRDCRWRFRKSDCRGAATPDRDRQSRIIIRRLGGTQRRRLRCDRILRWKRKRGLCSPLSRSSWLRTCPLLDRGRLSCF